MIQIKQTENELKTLAESLLNKAKQKGASAVELSIQKGEGLSAEVRMGDVETLEYHRDQSLSLTVYFGQRKGSASTADLCSSAIEDSVDAACRIAKYTSEDKFSGLADAELMAKNSPDLDLYHPWNIAAEEAIELAVRSETAALNADSRINNSDGASLNSYSGLGVYANSQGFIASQAASQHYINCAVIAQQDDRMERDGWYDISRLSSQLDSPEAIGKTAAKQVLKRLDARKLATCEAAVLYDPRMARSLVGHFIGAISGASQYRKASFLQDSLEQQVFPDFINLYERPYIPQALGSSAYDRDGVTTREQNFVEAGCVSNYLLGSYSARKLGLQTTANAGGAHNLCLESTGQSFAELLKTMHTGLLVTELMGSSVNMVTGDYSRGAAGFWVEKGEIQYAVKEITIAGNLKEMYQHIVAVGNDIDTKSATRTGSILIERMTIAGSGE
jgi:PmbA protein